MFSYGNEIRSLWDNMLNMEMDRVNIHFDLENNDSYDIKTRDLEFTGNDGNEQFRVKARISWAGGDWELPIYYFKCEFEQRSFYERDKDWGKWSYFIKSVIIPEKSNSNLIKGEKGMVAKDADSKDEKETNEKALWDEMVKIAENRIKKYWKAHTDYDGNTGFEDTGCVRELTAIYKK